MIDPAITEAADALFEAARTQIPIAPFSEVLTPHGVAGAYAVQGRAAAHIARIAGSYTGIMGLPLFETARLLKALKVFPRPGS